MPGILELVTELVELNCKPKIIGRWKVDVNEDGNKGIV